MIKPDTTNNTPSLTLRLEGRGNSASQVARNSPLPGQGEGWEGVDRLFGFPEVRRTSI